MRIQRIDEKRLRNLAQESARNFPLGGINLKESQVFENCFSEFLEAVKRLPCLGQKEAEAAASCTRIWTDENAVCALADGVDIFGFLGALPEDSQIEYQEDILDVDWKLVGELKKLGISEEELAGANATWPEFLEILVWLGRAGVDIKALFRHSIISEMEIHCMCNFLTAENLATCHSVKQIADTLGIEEDLL